MKKAIITALCLLTAGILLCVGAVALINFDFERLDTNMYSQKSYEFSERIDNIIIDCNNTADIEISPSEDNTAKVICFEKDNRRHLVTLIDSTLRIEEEHTEWYKNISFFSFKSPKITLYLPKKDYNSLSIECTTGDIDVTDLNAENFAIKTTTGDTTLKNITSTDLKISATTGHAKLSNVDTSNLNIKVSTGDAKLCKVTSENTEIKSSTGDITLSESRAENQLKVNVTTGDIKFENSDAKDIYCKSTTGSIKGTLLSNKVFITDTTTGSIDVPSSVEGGKCELKTTTGNIKISVVSE